MYKIKKLLKHKISLFIEKKVQKEVDKKIEWLFNAIKLLDINNFDGYNFVFNIADIKIYLPNFHRDHIQKIIIETKNFYEIELLEKFEDNFKNYIFNGVYVDVGANIGNHSLYFAKKFNINFFHSIEPCRATFEILEKNVNLNNYRSKFSTHNIAVGNYDGTVFLQYADEENIGMNFVNENPLLYKEKGENVRSMKLDDLLPNEFVSILKIDVEGYEFEVLKGAKKLLEKSKPIIWVEILNRDLLITLSDLIPYKFEMLELNEFNFVLVPTKISK